MELSITFTGAVTHTLYLQNIWASTGPTLVLQRHANLPNNKTISQMEGSALLKYTGTTTPLISQPDGPGGQARGIEGVLGGQ